MLGLECNLQEDYLPVSYDAWRALAEADLGGASFEQKLVTQTYEGINIKPLYTRHDQPGQDDPEGFPGLPPFVRGSQLLGAVQTGWDLRQEHAHPDLEVTNRAIHEDLRGGVTSLLLRLDCAARNGQDVDDPAAGDLAGRDGLMAYHTEDFDRALAGVPLDRVAIALEAGAAFLPAAALLVDLWKRRGLSPAQARGAFNADPLAVLVRDGYLPVPPEVALVQLADVAKFTAASYPQVTAVRVGTAPYHHAGATAVQDIAFGIATAVDYLRAMTRAGLSVDAAARQILFSISLGTHHFLAIPKLRSARRLWARVVAACGGSAAAGAMRIHSRVSKRVLTQRDPHVNMLRNTVACFAAGIGGAESITSVPFDAAIGLPDEFSRRLARNTLLILQEEAHLHGVIDPPGGSWYLDWLTNQVASKAWALFQDIERGGGMLAAIRTGWVARQIDSAFAPHAKNLARRKDGITGISEFPLAEETPIARPAPDRVALKANAAQRLAKVRRPNSALSRFAECRLQIADPSQGGSSDLQFAVCIQAASQGASIGQMAAALCFHAEPTAIAPLTPHPFARPFEELRDASDAWKARHGKRPRVFLVNLGSAAHYTGRATYAKNFFEAGGFEVLGEKSYPDAEAAARTFAESGATIAVICSSDNLYPEVVPQIAPKIKAAGAHCVVLAGNPGANEAAWRAVGVDRFIFIKCDVLATLRELLREEGVLPS
jgi:methylmalonyl-CoA mutase